ncbi:MAG: transcriptional regulator [Enterobacter hormaechei]
MESVLCNESDFGINMNNVTNSSIDFTPLVNEPLLWPVGVTIHWPKSSLWEWQELVGYKMIGITLLQRQPTIDRTTASRQATEAGLVYEVRHLSTSLGLVTGLGISALPGLAMPHAPYTSIIGIHWWAVIRRTLGLFAAKMRAFSGSWLLLLINLRTDDKDNLWTNNQHRTALQEIVNHRRRRDCRLNQR